MSEEWRCMSFLNKGLTRSEIAFKNTKSKTGLKGIHYLRDSGRYKVLWEGQYLGRVDTLEEAKQLQLSYRKFINQ